MELKVRRRYLSALVMLVIFIACCWPAVLAKNSTSESSNSCQMTKKSFVDSGLGTHHLHGKMTRDYGLRICSPEKTCCKRAAEEELHRQGLNSFKAMSQPMREKLQRAFHNRSEKFEVFWTALINNSYATLDMMFRTTYQQRYETNKQVFQDLYSMLKLYVLGDDIDLKQLCENFFALLYQKVYILFNPMYTYSKAYEACILETADVIKPFGDGPRRVTLQVSRSFLATRVFMEGLETGRSVVRELLRLKNGDSCRRAFTKMLRCAGCSNLDGVKPCYKYCLNVMKGCNAYLSVVNKQWTEFISAMLKLAHKLDGPFSIESIIEPLGVKISEAIMAFQDNQHNITTLVSKSCGEAPPKVFTGKPSQNQDAASRKARASFPFEFLGTGTGTKPPTAANTSLGRLLGKARAALEPLKDYWARMAYNVCASGIAEDPSNDKVCWNGVDASGYNLAVVNDGIPDMFQNPEVRLNISDPKIVVQTQAVKLKVMTSRILTALRGSDSKEVDVEEGSGKNEVGSGSGIEGSGASGSGDLTTESPTTIPTTTMGNNVDTINRVSTTDNTVVSVTNGNNIPGADNSNDVWSSGFPQTNAGSNSGSTHHMISSLTLLLFPVLQLVLLF